MNQIDRSPEGKPLPLPSPRSPATLDERILSQARRALPRDKPYRQPWWLAGSATAAVIVVAVTLSARDPGSFSDSAYDTAYDTAYEDFAAESMRVESSDEPEAAAAAPLAAEINEDVKKLGIESKEARSRLSESRNQAQAMPARQRLEVHSPVAKPEFEARSASLPKSRFAAKAKPSAFVDTGKSHGQLPEEILKSLRVLALQDHSSESSADERNSIRDYEELKNRCPECALPETLEQAIAEYLSQELPNP
ncbi:MAG: hypothetical protein AB8B81_11130 [Halioglobus sp.]